MARPRPDRSLSAASRSRTRNARPRKNSTEAADRMATAVLRSFSKTAEPRQALPTMPGRRPTVDMAMNEASDRRLAPAA